LDKKNYERLDDEGKMSLSRYMYYRYNETAESARTFRLKQDIFLSIFIILTLPPLLYFLIFFKRQAPMVFDRDKQIVYLWYKAKYAPSTLKIYGFMKTFK